MSKQYFYQLIDETGEDDYLVGIFESLEKANEILATIDEPIGDDYDVEYQDLILRQIELNKVEWSMDGDPVLKVEIQEVLIDVDKDIWGWKVTKWRWKKQENVPGKWEFTEEWLCNK